MHVEVAHLRVAQPLRSAGTQPHVVLGHRRANSRLFIDNAPTSSASARSSGYCPATNRSDATANAASSAQWRCSSRVWGSRNRSRIWFGRVAGSSGSVNARCPATSACPSGFHANTSFRRPSSNAGTNGVEASSALMGRWMRSIKAALEKWVQLQLCGRS